LFEFSDSLTYSERIAALVEKNIALWDVLYSCSRSGSLDSAIESGTIIVNDFRTFFGSHPLIKAIFFNGNKAEREFIKKVAPDVNLDHIVLHKLPSTSPAMAAMTVDQKKEAWSIIRSYL
jgi:TDG/mug DNA glycosylase family protein